MNWIGTSNDASSAVLKKCGMSLEGIERKKYYKDGKFIDTALWAIVAADRRCQINRN